jgi:hypothetical protein
MGSEKKTFNKRFLSLISKNPERLLKQLKRLPKRKLSNKLMRKIIKKSDH